MRCRLLLLASSFLLWNCASRPEYYGEPEDPDPPVSWDYADTVPWGRTDAARQSRSASDPPVAYEATQGERVQGPFAPYVTNYAELNRIPLDPILPVFFSGGPPPFRKNDAHALISSTEHLTGNWTYYHGRETSIYQMVQASGDGLAEGDTILFILYAKKPPVEILKSKLNTWTLALLTRTGRLLASQEFQTMNPEFATRNWTMLYTGLRLEGGKVLTTVSYVSEGGSKDEVRGFPFSFAVRGKSKEILPLDGITSQGEWIP